MVEEPRERSIKLHFIEGPRQGEDIIVKDDIIIGRSQGDITLRDNKVSNPHAKILIQKNSLEIEDLKSTNGTLVNGQKIEKVTIKIGDVITLGKTKLAIHSVLQVPKLKEEIKKDSWQDEVDRALALALKLGESLAIPKKTQFGYFHPPVVLEFIEGIQAGQEMAFGFGPRLVGGHCSDSLLYDADAPPIAFELGCLRDGGCEIRVRHEGVLINGNKIQKHRLTPGDQIAVGSTLIRFKTAEK